MTRDRRDGAASAALRSIDEMIANDSWSVEFDSSRLVFGLGDEDQVDEVTLRFPGGTRRLGPMLVDRYHRVSVESR